MSSNLKASGDCLGYLLLNDYHVIPLRGISPEKIKEGAKHRLIYHDEDLSYRRTLDAIVHCLGFKGDFGDFQNEHWSACLRFLKKNGCEPERQVRVFPKDNGDCLDFFFSSISDFNRRQLSDRIFEAPFPKPERVFLGYGVNWSTWDDGFPSRYNPSVARSLKGEALQVLCDLFGVGRNFIIDDTLRLSFVMRQWGFLDDKLVAPRSLAVVAKIYGGSTEGREKFHAKQTAAIHAFRTVIDAQLEGWVDVLPYNDRLVVLRTHDGGWDVLWRDYRAERPIHSHSATASERISQLLYLRRKVWDEHEAHLAEQAFYDRGGSVLERQATADALVRISWLREQGKWYPSLNAQEEGFPLQRGNLWWRSVELKRLFRELDKIPQNLESEAREVLEGALMVLHATLVVHVGAKPAVEVNLEQEFMKLAKVLGDMMPKNSVEMKQTLKELKIALSLVDTETSMKLEQALGSAEDTRKPSDSAFIH